MFMVRDIILLTAKLIRYTLVALTHNNGLSSPAPSPLPWLAKKMEHNNGMTSLSFTLSSDIPGSSTETWAETSRDLQQNL